MELLVLNPNLEAVAILDTFESLIWTDRYCGYGDFENYVPASMDMLALLRPDYYIWLGESDHLMIIEDCKIQEDSENGNHMIFTGRSAESLLDRRIIWAPTVLSGNLQNGIKKLLDENIISPTIADRQIPNFIFESSSDPAITSLTVDAQFLRANLYESIRDLCQANNIGFRVTLSNETNKLVFKLYSGSDRSFDQIQNPYVIFSPKFENILSTNYSNSRKTIKNVTVVVGEGEGTTQKTTVVGSGSSIDRREMYTDASSLSQTVDGVVLSEAVYTAQLAQKGIEDLSKHSLTQAFDGQIDTTRMFKYGEDFYMGDIVQLVSEYGIEGKAQITEIIRSQSNDGVSVYPTFTMID